MPVVTILKQIDLFRDLSEEQLQQIEQIVSEVTFAEGKTVCKQGDPADKIYIISAGQVEIVVEHDNGSQQSVLYLGSGQVIGEMTLVDEGQRSASVIAVEDSTRVYSIPNAKFTALCQYNTDIGYIIMRNIAQDMSFKLRHRDYDAKDG